jgi:hypothetical protein
MNQNADSVYMSIPRAKAEHSVRRTVSILLLAMLALALVGLAVSAVISSGRRAAESAQASVLRGPQVSVTQPVATSVAFMAANPEVRVFLRYAAARASAEGAGFVLANPEVRIFLHHQDTWTKPAEQSTLPVNPELNVMLRYAARVASIAGAEFLATNPEVRMFRQHAAGIAKQAEDDFLARNPEVRILLHHSNEWTGR